MGMFPNNVIGSSSESNATIVQAKFRQLEGRYCLNRATGVAFGVRTPLMIMPLAVTRNSDDQ